MNNPAGKTPRKSRLAKKYGDWALVTGASSGIGRAFARQIAAAGMNVVIVARRERALDALRAEIEKHHGVSVRVVVADLTSPESTARILEATRDLDIGLMIPNAGMEITGEFISTDLAAQEDLLRLNILSPLELTHAFARQMARRRRGGILLLASTFAFQGVPYVANYAASKAYILHFGEALSHEMKRHGVDVTVLAPGMTRTEMPAKMPVDFSRIPMKSMAPEAVARFGLKRLGRQPVAVPGMMNRMFAFMNRLMPRSAPVNMFGGMLKKALKGEARLKELPRAEQHPASGGGR